MSIYGEVSVEDRKEAVDRIQNDQQCRFLVGNPTTGGLAHLLLAILSSILAIIIT